MLQKSKLFYTFEKILNRVNFTEDTLPTNIDQWHEFIQRINNCFFDFEQERYLLERAMEISSREMLELNERFDVAQTTAHIGYWFYNPAIDKIQLSKESYQIFDLNPDVVVPNFNNFMRMVSEEDRADFAYLIERSLATGEDYEKTIRYYKACDKKIHCIYIKGHPYKIKNDASEYCMSGIAMDITERKQTEEELASVNTQLISLSRQAGMSEIATYVLHNIGNILNSVNISAGIIKESAASTHIKNLAKISQMIKNNLSLHPNYLQSDPKGKLIPQYLSDLSDTLLTENNNINIEIDNLITNIKHITNIVIMQNDFSGITDIKEKIFLPDMCELAIQMNSDPLNDKGIELLKNYQYPAFIVTDKSKVLQILVNLIKNAKESLKLSQKSQKILSISIIKPNNHIEIMVEDNGIGIDKNNLTKIFSMGFTTKVGGHGFGMHSSAIAAKNLNGELTVKSDGEEKGAIVTLKLPISTNNESVNNT